MKTTRSTNISEMLAASAVNAVFAIILSLPIAVFWGFVWQWKIVLVGVFFCEGMIFIFTGSKRCIGMRAVGSYWQHGYPIMKHVVYQILYTVSFSTLIFWIWFPFDLFIINMLCIQLPCVLLTGTTFHGLVSGRMVTVKRSMQN